MTAAMKIPAPRQPGDTTGALLEQAHIFDEARDPGLTAAFYSLAAAYGSEGQADDETDDGEDQQAS